MIVQLTTEEIAIRLQLTRDIAYKLVSFMEAAGIAQGVGMRRKEGAKGAGAKVFEIDPVGAGERLQKMLAALGA